MITDVPTADDFKKHGISFLNFAWDAVFALLLDPEDRDLVEEMEQTEKYWSAAKKPLSIAQALAQQGAELVLKAIIARESPYLLISGAPKDWPRASDKADVAFADFRTIDAQDLVRVCNTVSEELLSEQFVTTFEKFRKQRNTVFHTVDERLAFSAKEIITYILAVSQLVAPMEWPSLRGKYLSAQPATQAYGTDGLTNALCLEMKLMIGLLDRTEMLSFFAFDKKIRSYICPRCYWNCDRHYGRESSWTAQLQPNSPESVIVHCFVCGKDIPVVRKKCITDGCKGNVINKEDDCECLTCFEPQGE